VLRSTCDLVCGTCLCVNEVFLSPFSLLSRGFCSFVRPARFFPARLPRPPALICPSCDFVLRSRRAPLWLRTYFSARSVVAWFLGCAVRLSTICEGNAARFCGRRGGTCSNCMYGIEGWDVKLQLRGNWDSMAMICILYTQR